MFLYATQDCLPPQRPDHSQYSSFRHQGEKLEAACWTSGSQALGRGWKEKGQEGDLGFLGWRVRQHPQC